MLDAAGGLAAPGNLALPPPPPCPPEPNPAENVREHPRQDEPGPRVRPDDDATVATRRDARDRLVATPDRLASITRRERAEAVSNQGRWYETSNGGPRPDRESPRVAPTLPEAEVVRRRLWGNAPDPIDALEDGVFSAIRQTRPASG